MALSAGISPIDAIAFQTGFAASMQTVSDFPPRLFDIEDFQNLLRQATGLLVKYTGSPNPVQKEVDALLSQAQK